MMNFQTFIFASQDKQYILKHDGISVILCEENSFLDIEKPGRASNEEYQIKVLSIKTNSRDRTYGINHTGTNYSML